MKGYPLSFYQEPQAHLPLKVTLFTKVHELSGLNQQLHQVAALPPKQRKKWVTEHEGLLQDLLYTFSLNTSFEIEQQEFDSELRKLFIEYTSLLQELLRMVEGIFTPAQKLKG